VKAYIEGLPLEDDPEIFGLHPNANITFQKKTVLEFMSTILIVQPRVASGGKAKSPEQIVTEQAELVLSRLPAGMRVSEAHPTTFKILENGAMQSIGVFVNQEIQRFNKLLAIMKQSLEEIQKAIKGTVVMSLDLESMFHNFIDNRVPQKWTEAGYPSLKPLSSWFEDLIRRVQFLSDWLYKGPPKSFWISAFFFPQGFMTAALQTYARFTKIAIDTLKFRTNVRDYSAEKAAELPEPETGINIHGLYLQGADFNTHTRKIVESQPGVLFSAMPVIWLEPVDETVKFEDKAFDCPLYKTSLRQGELSTTGHSTNFVLFLQLSSSQKPEYWINRGAALLCQLDD
jgi:dynein heavy chain, axonemal